MLPMRLVVFRLCAIYFTKPYANITVGGRMQYYVGSPVVHFSRRAHAPYLISRGAFVVTAGRRYYEKAADTEGVRNDYGSYNPLETAAELSVTQPKRVVRAQ